VVSSKAWVSQWSEPLTCLDRGQPELVHLVLVIGEQLVAEQLLDLLLLHLVAKGLVSLEHLVLLEEVVVARALLVEALEVLDDVVLVEDVALVPAVRE